MNEERLRSWVWWRPGQSEDALYGFVSREERDECQRGGKGPFRRIIRTKPRSLETAVVGTVTRRAARKE